MDITNYIPNIIEVRTDVLKLGNRLIQAYLEHFWGGQDSHGTLPLKSEQLLQAQIF